MMIGKSFYTYPESWEIVKLGAFVESEKGKKPKLQVDEQSELFSLPYVDIEAFEKGIITSWTDGHDCRMCYETDLLMVWDGSRSGLVGKGIKGALGSTLVRIKFPSMENQYVFYFLQYKYRQINSSVKGSGTPHVDPDLLWNYEIPIPPLNEQRRIVAKIEELFSELDKGVESLKTARAKLNVYRQTVLKHAFEGKLTAQWREENKDKLEKPEQLSARIKQERAARYQRQLREWETAVKEWEKNEKKGKKPVRPRESNPVESIEEVLCKKLPTITDRWVWVRLKQVGRIETGTTPSTKYPGNYGGKLPFFKPTDLDQGAHVQTAREYLSEIGAESARVLPADSILVTCIGATIGKTGFTRLSCATNQQINSVSPDAGFDSKFVYLQALAPFFNSKVKSEASATTLPILNKSKFEELPFILCTLTEQQEIVRLLERRFVAVEQQERGIDSALEQAEILRQSILKKAFSGKLVVQDSHDEPASILLDRIRIEREKAMQFNYSKKTKKRKTAV